MKSILLLLFACLILAVAAFSGEILFGSGVEVDGMRNFLRERVQ